MDIQTLLHVVLGWRLLAGYYLRFDIQWFLRFSRSQNSRSRSSVRSRQKTVLVLAQKDPRVPAFRNRHNHVRQTKRKNASDSSSDSCGEEVVGTPMDKLRTIVD